MRDIYSEYDAMRGTVLLSSLLWIRQSDSPYSYWKTEFLIQPDLLIDFTNDVSDIGTTNENVIAELQEAGQRASQRRSILERLRWGADILDGFVTVVGVASDVRRP